MPKYDWNTDTIAAATEAWRNETAVQTLADLYGHLGCFPTSQHGDVAAITWHSLYHTGNPPVGVRASRGSSLIVDSGYGETVARVQDPQDHRAGVYRQDGLGS